MATTARRIYQFDLGDSTRGPLGAVLEVPALSSAHAVRLVRELLQRGEPTTVVVDVPGRDAQVQLRFYINADAIGPEHITEERPDRGRA